MRSYIRHVAIILVFMPLLAVSGPSIDELMEQKGPEGCTLRDLVLARTSEGEVLVDKCQVIRGVWTDALTAERHEDPEDLVVDWIVPVEKAVADGVLRGRASALVLDPRNQIVVTREGKTARKGLSMGRTRIDPRQWCNLVERWEDVETRYAMKLDDVDQEAQARMRQVCVETNEGLSTNVQAMMSVSACGASCMWEGFWLWALER